MPQAKHTFRALIEAAAKPHRELWKSSGDLNLGALERFTDRKGYKISQASFSRIFAGKQDAGEEIIHAAHKAFQIPRQLLRGESVAAEMEDLLSKYHMSTILLAQKLERLPKDDYYLIAKQVDRALENAENVRQAMKGGNVTPLRRNTDD